MHAPSRSPHPALLITLLGSLLGTGSSLANRDTDVVLQPGPEALSLPHALDLLWGGRPEEKRLAVEDAGIWGNGVDFDDPADSEATGAVKALRTILRTERDDWIVGRLLQNLLPFQGQLLDPLYREALERGSPNAKWRAIQWFSTRENGEALPLLESEWRREKRPWVLADLMEALARNGSAGILDDLVDLVNGQDPALAQAAVRAIVQIGGDSALQELIRLSQGREPGPEYTIRPAEHRLTIRCWEFPAVAGLPEDFPRIPRGSTVHVRDHFEMEGSSWVEVSGEEADDCWVPFDLLAPVASVPMAPDDEAAAAASFRREADVPRQELDSEAAKAFMDAGLLEIIDETDEVIGIALSADPLDTSSLGPLLRSYRDDDSWIAWHFEKLLQQLHDAAPEQPDLREFFRRRAEAGRVKDEDAAPDDAED